MSIYNKRKKRKYSEDGVPEKQSFVERHRELIVFLLVLIIVAGAVAAVNAYELKRNARIIGADKGEAELSYYESGAEGSSDANAGSDVAAAQGEGSGAEGSGASAGDSTESTLGAGSGTAAEGSEDESSYPDFSQNEVTWKGKSYKRNTYVKPILLLGVDNAGSMHEAKEFGNAGQSDGVFLIAQDTARNRVKLLMIPRDTMTEVMELNAATGKIEPFVDHLCLAYCFGDGMASSCENTKTAVQGLLMKLKIDDYMAIDTSALASVNDAVGGVTVTIPTEGMTKADEAFVYGETVTLKGKQAERFIRYRDTGVDNSAISRMGQHRQYISGFYKAIRQKAATDSNIVTKLYDVVQDYMVTNMSKEVYLKTALDVLQQGEFDDSSMLTLPGYSTTTELYDEFYADKTGIVECVLSMFYREV